MTPWWSSLAAAGLAVVGSVLGYVLAGLNDARRDHRTASRETEVRAKEALAARVAERHRFQLETLLALQTDLQAYARSAGRTMSFDHMQARRGQYTQLPPEWSDEDLAHTVALSRTTARVLDHDLRAAIGAFTELATRLSMSPRPLEGLAGEALENLALARFAQLATAADAVQQRVGQAVRAELAWASDSP